MYYPKTHSANQILTYFYDDARLSKVCDISEKEKIEDCETYRYFDDGSFVKNGSFNDVRVEITYDKIIMKSSVSLLIRMVVCLMRATRLNTDSMNRVM
ncbi:Uncharacterised protein [Aggregatibacter aphrophilus]|uniref:Uncharacterized protein n=1 Tax=Aggregatibacter aphrophilus TaxID=732 RepID=A0A336NHM6_AGGAP|nr:Uncharacterised protein [Aggregatibacter aphrophilus]